MPSTVRARLAELDDLIEDLRDQARRPQPSGITLTEIAADLAQIAVFFRHFA